MSRKELPWQSVWITGAGKGIGSALAIRLCQMGLTVYASSRTESDLQRLRQQTAGEQGELIPLPLDITRPDQIDALMQQWDHAAGLPDLVILNAGTHDPFSAREFSAERCKRLLEINLQGSINCLEPVLNRCIQRDRGHIAVMASVAGYRGLPTAAAYGASKAALINLCEALYLDLQNSGVRIQLINPGFVRTPLTDKNEFAMPALLETEDAAERIIRGLQQDRFEICFPKRFTYWLKLLRLLPYRCYLWLIGKTVKAPE